MHSIPLTYMITAATMLGLGQASLSNAETPLSYPPAARGGVVEELHGQKIPDPYRWLEDLDSPATQAFAKAEAKLTETYLAAIPERETIKAALKKLWNYDRLGLPISEGGRTFYTRRTGLQNQSVLYWKASPEGPEKVLLDPNTLSKDGTVALGDWAPSQDGHTLAYSLSVAGSDWEEFRFLEIETGKALPDVLKWIKFSRPSWNREGTGIYYSRYAEPKGGTDLKGVNLNQKVYFHRLGEPQAQDILIHENPKDPKMQFGAYESDDARFLLLGGRRGTEPKNAFWYRARSAAATEAFLPVFDKFDAEYNYVGNLGTTFYFITDKGAPNQRLVAVNVTQPEEAHWITLLPEEKFPLRHVSLLGDKFIVTRLVNAASQVSTYDLKGQPLGLIPTPPMSTIGGFGGRQEAKETHYMVTNYVLPGQIYRYDCASGQSTLVSQVQAPFDPTKYHAEQQFVTSKDGTQVPIFVVSKIGTAKDGKNPTLLYGYGGFDISMTPGFSPSTIAWLDQGGVYAVACLRGGGEYGRAWHDSGKHLKKQNVFNDFIAAGEWLISQGYTSKSRLGIKGGSNGGLLTAACALQRPDLFGAVISSVGVHDMLRFHKFTIGWAWQDEYGHVDQKEDFQNMLAYSPVQVGASAKQIPPMLILTGDHDDRVFPAHSFKLAATLQKAIPQGNPVLLRVDIKAGHGAGKPTAKAMDETADEFAFLRKHLQG